MRTNTFSQKCLTIVTVYQFGALLGRNHRSDYFKHLTFRSSFGLIRSAIRAVGAFKNSDSGIRRGSRGDGKSGAENSEEGFDSDGFELFWDHKQGDANNNNYMQTNRNEHKLSEWEEKEWAQFWDKLQTTKKEISSEYFTQ